MPPELFLLLYNYLQGPPFSHLCSGLPPSQLSTLLLSHTLRTSISLLHKVSIDKVTSLGEFSYELMNDSYGVLDWAA